MSEMFAHESARFDFHNQRNSDFPMFMGSFGYNGTDLYTQIANDLINWRCKADIHIYRDIIRAKIAKFFGLPFTWEQEVTSCYVNYFEESLFQDAASLEEYLNPNVISLRLKNLIANYTASAFQGMPSVSYGDANYDLAPLPPTLDFQYGLPFNYAQESAHCDPLVEQSIFMHCQPCTTRLPFEKDSRKRNGQSVFWSSEDMQPTAERPKSNLGNSQNFSSQPERNSYKACIGVSGPPSSSSLQTPAKHSNSSCLENLQTENWNSRNLMESSSRKFADSISLCLMILRTCGHQQNV